MRQAARIRCDEAAEKVNAAFDIYDSPILTFLKVFLNTLISIVLAVHREQVLHFLANVIGNHHERLTMNIRRNTHRENCRGTFSLCRLEFDLCICSACRYSCQYCHYSY